MKKIELTMKRIFIQKIFLSFFFLFLTNALYAESRVNIAVLDFKSINVSAADAVAISDFVRTSLIRSNIFNVVERNNIDKILAEQGIQQAGCVTEECAIQIGKLLNVRKAVIGSYSKIEDIYFITANVVDIETAKISDSERVQFNNISDIAEAVDELCSFIAGKKIATSLTMRQEIPQITYIKKVSTFTYEGEEKVYYEAVINRGVYDDVKERFLYDILSPQDLTYVGKFRVTDSYGRNGAIGIAFDLKEKITPGYCIKRQGKFRMHGIGFIGGLTSGSGAERTAGGSGVYYDRIYASGWGFRIERSFYYLRYRLSDTVEVESEYRNPVILKYNTRPLFPTSPYFGFGLYSYHQSPGLTRPEIDSRQCVFNCGINFFKTSAVNLGIDWKHFFEGDSAADALSLSLSINW